MRGAQRGRGQPVDLVRETSIVGDLVDVATLLPALPTRSSQRTKAVVALAPSLA